MSKAVKRVLMCRPTHFTVDYIINPHMQPYSVDQPKAMKQWEALAKVLKSLKIKVDVIEQEADSPDMVFATDQGVVRDGAVLLANFRYSQRAKERIYYREWFRANGFRLRALTNIFPFEGGDACFFDTILMIGTGFRADVATCDELSNKFGIDVIPLRLVNPHFYLIDMCLLPIDDKTAFYYPAAFSDSSQSLLKRLVPNLIPLSEKAAKAYAANSFVSGKDIITSVDVPAAFKKDLDKLGMKVHLVDVSEFNKAGGGIRCLINTLE